MFKILNKIKTDLLNLGLKFINVDEKLIRIFLETGSSNINEIVILPAVRMVMKKIINKLQNKHSHGRLYNGILNGVKVSVVRSLVGCPNCAVTVECLKRCNVKTIIRIDFCGGIEIDNLPVQVGDILIPKIAYCGDGTAPYYIAKFPESIKNFNLIKNPLSNNDINSNIHNILLSEPNETIIKILANEGKEYNAKVCDLWTTDALFCETLEFLDAVKALNIQGIDMESSILFLLGKLYNIKTASILSVSDLPGHPKYDLFKANEIHPNMMNGIDNAIKILIKSLPRIKNEI